MEHQLKFKIAQTVFLIKCRDKKIISWLKQNYAPFLCRQKPHLEAIVKFDKAWARDQGKQAVSSVDSKAGVFSYHFETFDAEIQLFSQCHKRRKSVRRDLQ